MKYYVKYEGEVVLGPFDSIEDASKAGAKESIRRIREDGDDGDFGLKFKVRPEWTYVEDPSGWHAWHHIKQPQSLFIEETDTTFNVGIYEPDNEDRPGKVIGDVASCENFGEAVTEMIENIEKITEGDVE